MAGLSFEDRKKLKKELAIIPELQKSKREFYNFRRGDTSLSMTNALPSMIPQDMGDKPVAKMPAQVPVEVKEEEVKAEEAYTVVEDVSAHWKANTDSDAFGEPNGSPDKHVLEFDPATKKYRFKLRQDVPVELLRKGDVYEIAIGKIPPIPLTRGLMKILTYQGSKQVGRLDADVNVGGPTIEDKMRAFLIYNTLRVKRTDTISQEANDNIVNGKSFTPNQIKSNKILWLGNQFRELKTQKIEKFPVEFMPFTDMAGYGLGKKWTVASREGRKLENLALMAASKQAGNTSKRMDQQMKKILKGII